MKEFDKKAACTEDVWHGGNLIIPRGQTVYYCREDGKMKVLTSDSKGMKVYQMSDRYFLGHFKRNRNRGGK